MVPRPFFGGPAGVLFCFCASDPPVALITVLVFFSFFVAVSGGKSFAPTTSPPPTTRLFRFVFQAVGACMFYGWGVG